MWLKKSDDQTKSPVVTSTNAITALTIPDNRGRQAFSEKNPKVSILGSVGQEDEGYYVGTYKRKKTNFH